MDHAVDSSSRVYVFGLSASIRRAGGWRAAAKLWRSAPRLRFARVLVEARDRVLTALRSWRTSGRVPWMSIISRCRCPRSAVPRDTGTSRTGSPPCRPRLPLRGPVRSRATAASHCAAAQQPAAPDAPPCRPAEPAFKALGLPVAVTLGAITLLSGRPQALARAAPAEPTSPRLSIAVMPFRN